MSSQLSFQGTTGRDFKATVTPGGEGVWRIDCHGTIDQTDASTSVQPVLMQLHEELVQSGINRVEVDLAAVEYMNSSGLKGFIAWFLAAEYSNGGPRYAIELVYDPKKTWQAVSLTVMEKVAPRAVKVRAMREAA
jgi:hypothetical protein